MSNEERFIQLEILSDRELRDRLSEVLWELGTQGFEEAILEDSLLRITAYFPGEQPVETCRRTFLSAAEQAGCSVRSCTGEAVSCDPDEWLVEYSKSFRAFPIGSEYYVYPSWDAPDSNYPVNLRLDPGHGFGTGTHESTQLVMLALVDVVQNAESLLDVGTGSGILAIAAKKLRPALRVVACDTDGLAVEFARENLVHNEIAGVDLINAGPDAISGTYDVVLANLTCNILRRIDSHIVRLSARDLIVSGFTSEQCALVVDCFCEQHAFRIQQKFELNDWVCLHLQRWPLS